MSLEVAGRPKLVIRYPTEPGCIAALLPPGLQPCGEPVVQIGVYCVPVHGEPEYGISVGVPASVDGREGRYSLGIGIDQESAIFISRETNGQPKFPCSVRYFRLGEEVHASATHQGHTFVSYAGRSLGPQEVTAPESEENEWWIKVSRAVGGVAKAYDLLPHVVRVRSVGAVVQREPLEGELVLRPSDWDPVARLLPVVGAASAELVTTRFSAREITLDRELDPEAFWPFADTIGGSRWPGERGGPRRPA